MPSESGPVTTGLRYRRRQHPLRQQTCLFNRVDIQSSAYMPSDVAMKRPHAGVVCVVLQDEISRSGCAAGLNELHITTLSVALMGDGSIPGSYTLGKDIEIMAVEMHGVGSEEFVLDDKADGCVVAKVVNIPLRIEGVRGVALICTNKNWVVIVGAERFSVHVEEIIVGLVGTEGDGNILRDSGIRSCREGEERRSFTEIVILAFAVIVDSGF